MKTVLQAGTILSCIFIDALLCNGQQNGISVGKPKVFDSRALELMTKRFEEDLQDLRFVDKQALSKAIGGFQGYRATESANTFFLTTPSTPQTSVDRVTNTGATTTSTVTEKTSIPAATPQLAGVQDPLKDGPSLSVPYGPSAEDLLADQVNLTYKIMNLRMILERALSDRLWDGHARLQAVLGFQISVDPPKDATDTAAVVEITVRPKLHPPQRRRGVDLVALMPQEKTYNSAAVSDKANAFGGTAVTSIMNIGFTRRYRSKTVYLYRDSDTTAFDRMPVESDGSEDCVRFGWIFRPVLGRRSVSPGLRQLFAVVALPAKDSLPVIAGEAEDFPLEVIARTYWVKYDRSKLTVDEDLRKWPKSSNYKLPLLTTESYDVSVARTEKFTRALTPVVIDAEVTATGLDCVVVSVTGRNFFSGTTILPDGKGCGDVGSALLIKSETALQVRTTKSAPATGDLVINGRYGPSIPLRVADEKKGGVMIGRLELDDTTNNAAALLRIDLLSPNFQPLRMDDLPKGREPLVTINGRLLAERAAPSAVPSCEFRLRVDGAEKSIQADCIRLLMWVPKDLWAEDMVFRVRYPLRGPEWDASQRLTRPSARIELVRLGGNDEKTWYAINTPNPNINWKIHADRPYDSTNGLRLVGQVGLQQLILELPKTVAQGMKSIVVIPEGAPPVTLSLPEEKPKAEPAVITKADTALEVKQNDSVALEWLGSGLNGVTAVNFEDLSIPFEALTGGKKIRIYVSRAVTAKPGMVNLRLKTATDTKLVAIRIAPVNTTEAK